MSRAHISDYLIVIGHLWYCPDCRQAFTQNPHALLKGLKLTPEQKALLLGWAAEPVALVDRLRTDSGLAPEVLQQGITHPRARLRHLGVQRRTS